jgi:hypothetical protein
MSQSRRRLGGSIFVAGGGNWLGIRGNGHEFMLQNNADRIARIYVDWLGKNVK